MLPPALGCLPNANGIPQTVLFMVVDARHTIRDYQSDALPRRYPMIRSQFSSSLFRPATVDRQSSPPAVPPLAVSEWRALVLSVEGLLWWERHARQFVELIPEASLGARHGLAPPIS